MRVKEKTEELVVVDVSRYKKVKNALKDSEARYRLLFENMSLGVFRITAGGKIVDTNPALLKMLGYSSFSELEHWQSEKNNHEFLETWRELCNQIDQQGAVGGFDLTWRKKDNSPLFIHVNARVISASDGKVLFYEGTIEDSSERKEAENLERALYEIARVPERANSLAALYQSVHLIIKGLMPAENFYVALYDEKENLLCFPYFVDEIDEPPLPRKSGKGLTEYVLHTGRTLLYNAALRKEMSCCEQAKEVGAPSSCWLGVPLKAGNKNIGVIAIQHYSDPNAYSEREMQILEYVSGQVANTIEHKRAEEELQQSKVQLQVILESTADGILAIDHKGKVIKVNKRFAELWRIPQDLLSTLDDNALLNYVLGQLINPNEFLAKVRLLYQSTAEDSDILTFKDGRIFERFSAPLFISDSSIGRVWSFRDVTERKRAEEAIAWEKAFMDALVETAPEGIVFADNQACVQRVNNEFVRMFGYEVAEVTGKIIDTLIVSSAYQEEANTITKFTGQGKKCVFETVRKKKDGTLIHVSVISAPIHIAGKQVAVYAIYRDINEPKHAEIERQALFEVMQGLVAVENLHDFLSNVHKSISQVIFAENFFVAIYNKDTAMFEEVYSVDKFDPPAQPSKLEKSISGYVFRTGKPLLLTQKRFAELAARGEMELVGTNSPSWLGVPLKTSRETIGVMVVQDYNKENRYSARERDFLVSIAGQVAQVVERKRAEEQIHASLKEKEVLLQEIHHRVKNNLMSIIGLIQMQGIKAKNETLNTLLMELEGRVRAMAIVHENLHKSENLAHIDLQTYIETMVVQIRAQFEAGRDIRFLIQATGVEVGLDIAIPCGLILNELITNAFKYAFPGDKTCFGMQNCEIIVSMNQDETGFTLAVADNGVGLPEDLDLEQAETLGLRLVKMLSQQIKGIMAIDRTGGTTFRLRFAKPAYIDKQNAAEKK